MTRHNATQSDKDLGVPDFCPGAAQHDATLCNKIRSDAAILNEPCHTFSM